MVVLALNARHVIMGAALSPWINRLPAWQRVLTLGYLSDPNFADSQASFQDGEKDAGVLLGGGLVLWAFWVAGTAVGAFGGNAIGDTSAFGIDVVMPCFFVSLVVARMRIGRSFAPVVTATAVSVVLLGLVPTGWNIVLAALAGGLIGALFHAE
jgi:predicted branched-subunit amino acid permease